MTVYNNVGSNESKSASIITDPDIPSGLDAPTLFPVSSTKILARWQPPRNPNGVVLNYTLFVKQLISDDHKVGEKLFYNRMIGKLRKFIFTTTKIYMYL